MTSTRGRFKAGPRIVRLTPSHLEALAADLRAFGILSDAMALDRRLGRVSRPATGGRIDDAQ